MNVHKRDKILRIGNLSEQILNLKMGQNHSDRRNHVANGSNVDIYVQVLR